MCGEVGQTMANRAQGTRCKKRALPYSGASAQPVIECGFHCFFGMRTD